MTSIFIREEKRKRHREAQGRWPCEDGSGDWSYVATPRNTYGHQKLEEARVGFSRDISEGVEPC